ncbi:dynein regulatory complex protein 10 [Etheostoma cragini]|uniref:dynein regulatory complex protein 10 n=1 Tax=Etheostoma cragini TaxID=417921 RepID=UPI00155E5C63|nr:dynein regulatory complex protein 10 [Etheostoma cragini]
MSANRATELAKTGTHSEEDLNNKDMSQKKLLSLEAQHISSMLENCISQVEFAAALPAVLRFNSASSVVDKELSRALQEHQILDKSLEGLIGLQQESEEEQEGAFGEARAELEKDIKNSVRNLLRLVRAHPDALCGLRTELGVEVGESEDMLISGLKEFHTHVVEQLLTSPDEELLLLLHNQVSSSPGQDLEHLVLMEEEVAKSMKQIDEMISEKNVEIQNLQIGLNGPIRQDTGVSLLVEKQRQSHNKAAKVKHTSIQQEIDRLNSQLNNLILENREAEREIQTKNEKVEEEIEYLLQTFDDVIGENQANLELNKMDYEKEEEELMKLKTPFSALEVECNQIQEKRRLAEEKRREALRELELKTKAAIFAQAWWRGYSTRKALKNKGKSKKAKKGKGKKTK